MLCNFDFSTLTISEGAIMKTAGLVLMYLTAIVLANLSVAYFGPSSTVINAFLLIGLDLTCRDVLQEKWTQNRWLKLAALIIVGSLLSWFMNRDAGRIALASCIAFLASGITDTVIYTLLKNNKWFIKVNSSNAVSSVVDSVLFISLAFGFPILWSIVFLQCLAKIAGGFMWSMILMKDTKQHGILSIKKQ